MLAFRKQLIHRLVEDFGYEYIDKRQDRATAFEPRSSKHGPRVDGVRLLADMERINQGEAHYRAESPCVKMELVGDKLDMERFFDMLLCGYEFIVKRGSAGYDRAQGGKEQYGVVQFVDWNNLRNNTLTVYEGWQSAPQSGAAWDLVIAINHIPVVAVMLAPTTPGHRPCEEAYDEMRRQLDADPCFSTYAMVCILSDGETTLVGGPDDPGEWFLPWGADCQNAHVPSESQNGNASISSLLHPQTLLRYLYAFVRLVGSPDGLIRYVAHSHQFYGVLAATDHLLHGVGRGYVALPQRDEVSRPYPFGTNYDTTRQLMKDYLSSLAALGEDIALHDDPGERESPVVRFEVLPAMSLQMPEGECLYRPQRALVSPLSND